MAVIRTDGGPIRNRRHTATLERVTIEPPPEGTPFIRAGTVIAAGTTTRLNSFSLGDHGKGWSFGKQQKMNRKVIGEISKTFVESPDMLGVALILMSLFHVKHPELFLYGGAPSWATLPFMLLCGLFLCSGFLFRYRGSFFQGRF